MNGEHRPVARSERLDRERDQRRVQRETGEHGAGPRDGRGFSSVENGDFRGKENAGPVALSRGEAAPDLPVVAEFEALAAREGNLLEDAEEDRDDRERG